MFAIETRGLKRTFGRHVAVDDVDLRVPVGGIYGFLGPNGAGKTTTLRIVLGILKADAGEVRLFGEPPARERRIGSMVEMPVIYDHLTGAENLGVTQRLLGLPRSDIARVLEIVDMRDAATRRAGGYSLGMRQRLGLARALLGSPPLLVLDEPSNGLDPDGMRDMRTLLRALVADGGVTILVSSHLLSEIDQLADHVGLMRQGRLVAQGPIAEVVGDDGTLLDIDVDDPERASALLAAMSARQSVEGDRITVSLASGATVAAANRLLVENGFAVSRLAVRKRSLEDVYLSGDLGAEHAS